MARKSIFEEIMNSYTYSEADLKRRADHIITSAINLLDSIEKDYGEDATKCLERRLLASIKNRKPSKFTIKNTDLESMHNTKGDNVR